MHLFRRSPPRDTQPIKLMATLWPSFSHFPRFARDARLTDVRLNSAMVNSDDLDHELAIISKLTDSLPLYFDVKGRQMRIVEVHDNPDTLEVTINHPICVPTPVTVLFKAGEDNGTLGKVSADGRRLVFARPPFYEVRVGESLYIRDPEFIAGGAQFTQAELEKIEKVKKAGFTRFFLSYVQKACDVDEFLDLVGPSCEIRLKIEDKQGLEYVARKFKKRDNLTLVAARGDLYVEINKPHELFEAQDLIISKDPHAIAASRLLLSVVKSPVPDCADLAELGWLYDHGYRNFMLCDEICLHEEMLATGINAFTAFADSYRQTRITQRI